eukprot:Gregarina_sp_Pseudo_9__426@NODE_1278_length_1720_cov_53_398572_g1201_i0_p1_GENE_NODE_1278_length_1720_cov_53_398572_g1201_i0NODE_1278_length_1720_cov_53_398572_g1201_i0_p1_ORF_typecomplete_len281_score64_83Hydrolase_3/PF08282_12/4_1e47S6PP/PF05116_13/1_1e02S6PP/PF05116_13/1_1e07HAD/PF12710_7/2_4e05DAO/PF01266_24/0_016Trehalose_PPase/PF02358_16/0_25Hydrolase_6/PF13344_6/0_034_NODE_1278_length_1720_cov_53_398572_g1201_i0156998
MPIRFVFSDLDGTVLHDNSLVPDSCVAALNLLATNNVRVYPATGRSLKSARGVMGEHMGAGAGCIPPCPGVYSDGLVVFGDTEDEIVYEHLLDADMAAKLVKTLDEMFPGIDIMLGTRKGTHVMRPTPTTLAFTQRWKETHIVVENVAECAQISGAGALYIIVLAPEEIANSVQNWLETNYSASQLKLYRVNSDLVSIMRPGCSKWDGICKLAERYKLDLSEAITIGDGSNDLDMLRECAHSIAMGNGCVEAKKSAKTVTDGILEDGWAKGVLAAAGLPN